jgi:hypothetical protein
MAEPINTEPIKLELELSPSSQIDLNEEWIAYLDQADIPSCVDGVDSSINYADDDGQSAYA